MVEEMEFPMSVRWRGGRLAHADARGKESLELATPPEFRGGLTGYWSPEELLVAATASCYALTLAAVADQSDTPLIDATVNATGYMNRAEDGRFGFTAIEIDAVLETVPGGEDAVARAAAAAEDRCLVGRTLDVPVDVTVQVKTVVRRPQAVEILS
jgi:organic hydroperoxide reductase OsmC/OhrA